MTLDIMEKFGVSVNRDYENLVVKSGQKYTGTDYKIEGDYSSASYFFALGALTGSGVAVRNLNSQSRQAPYPLSNHFRKREIIHQCKFHKTTFP